jgi:hypothetical protein
MPGTRLSSTGGTAVKIVIALAATLAAATGVAAEPAFPYLDSRALRPECKMLVAKLISSGAEYDRMTDSGISASVFLKDRHIGWFTLYCGATSDMTDIDANSETAHPPQQWFDGVARLGSILTGEISNKLDTGMKKCQQAALKDKTELATADTPKAHLECQAFTRDGGDVVMSVWIK